MYSRRLNLAEANEVRRLESPLNHKKAVRQRPLLGISFAPIHQLRVTDVYHLPAIVAYQSRTGLTAAVTTTIIDAKENLVGFQGDLIFDERVLQFADEPVEAARLTAENWTVAGKCASRRRPDPDVAHFSVLE
jgi:hypothetical protein